MELYDLMQRSDTLSDQWIADVFSFALKHEDTGEARRQLGYFDGYEGLEAASQNGDYLKGWNQGKLMRGISCESF